MDYNYKLELLLSSTLTVFKEVFFSRWRISQNCEWCDSREFGAKLLTILERKDYRNMQTIQKNMVEHGDSNNWDLILLSLLLRKGKFLGYKSQPEVDIENKAIEDAAKIRKALSLFGSKKMAELDFETNINEIRRILETINVPNDQIDGMIEDAERGAVFAEREVKILKLEGNNFCVLENYKEACNSYSKAINLAKTLPNNFVATLYSNRAIAYMKIVSKEMGIDEQQCYFELALQDAITAMDLRPGWFKPYKRAGDAHRLLKNWADAIINYEKCIALDLSMKQEVQKKLETCKVMANIRLISDPEEDEEPNMAFEERIEEWKVTNQDPNLNKSKWIELEENFKTFGNGQGFAMQGDRYRFGWELPKDLDEAMRCYIKAWKMGNPEGAYTLGKLKLLGHDTKRDPKAGFRLFKDAANMPINDLYSAHWVSEAQFAMGSCYELGLGIEQSFILAAKWFEKAAQGGSTRAAFYLAEMYNVGKGVPKSKAFALSYWQLAAVGKTASTAILQLCLNSLEPQKLELKQKLEQMKAAGEIDQEQFDLCDNLLQNPQQIETLSNPICTTEYVPSDRKNKYAIENLLPFAKSSQMARKFLKAKYAHAKFSSILEDSVDYNIPLETIDLFFEAYQPDVEFVHKSNFVHINKFHQFCMHLLKSTDIEPRLEKKIRFAASKTIEDDHLRKTFLDESVKKFPDDLPLLIFLTNGCGYIGRFKEGIKVADKILKIAPHNRDALFAKSTHLRLLNKPEALEVTMDLIEVTDVEDRKRPEIFYAVSVLWLRRKREDMFWKHWEAGREAEGKLLPCFLPYRNNWRNKADTFAAVVPRKGEQTFKD